ncbi:hypothetical protein DFJ74DRAFT_336063 [Hyaloraphidium curvatum]|nr:hypothetical protein DFJ74DRAFT_462668 [Hyaloraphidium curvatum]KAI9010047.1 hypothetical protein DFJ74DRAFT_336063 [Hyaloraphidium curvatum]
MSPLLLQFNRVCRSGGAVIRGAGWPRRDFLSPANLPQIVSRADSLPTTMAASGADDVILQKDADFLPEEWLALFPAPSPPVPTFGDEEQGANPEDAARAADPLTADGILRDLGGAAKVAAWPVLRVHAALPGWFTALAISPSSAATIALLGLTVPLAGDMFTAKDVALGIAGTTLFLTGLSVSYGLVSPFLGANIFRNGLVEFSHVAALCRWLRLVGRGKTPQGVEAASSPLVRHVPGDLSCPCTSCCSWVESTSGILDFLDLFGNVSLGWMVLFFFAYTPVVTFGAALWSTWYGALLGAIWASMFPAYIFTALSRLLGNDNMAHTALQRRLHCRAVDMAMADLLSRFRSAAAAGDAPPRADSWLYVRLHYRFAALCRFRRQQDGIVISRLYGLALVPGAVLLTALYAAVGRCISAWQLAVFAHAAVYFTVNAVNLASRNSLIDAVAAVYRDAQRELRALALRTGPGPLADEIALHDRAIASFQDVARYRAKLFGFVVSFGTVRTMLVTGLTVAVALWSVLRAFGVTATLESFCPVS